MMSLENKKLSCLLGKIKKKIDSPQLGLGDELFLFATELTPMINVDLLIKDKNNRILLSWRKDNFYDEGWHVPGGVIRLKESIEHRILEVSKNEIGCDNIVYKKEPTEVVQIICPEMQQRGHFITLVYECSLPDGFEVHNDVNEYEAGYLKWFSECPADLLDVHSFYRKYWQ